MPCEREGHPVRERATQRVKLSEHPGPRSALRRAEPWRFRVDVESRRDHVEVAAIGELDLANAGVFGQRLRELEARFVDVVLDLRGLSFIDCSGLWIVLAAASRARELGRRFVVIYGDGQVKRLIELTRVDRQLDLSDQPVVTVESHVDPGMAA